MRPWGVEKSGNLYSHLTRKGPSNVVVYCSGSRQSLPPLLRLESLFLFGPKEGGSSRHRWGSPSLTPVHLCPNLPREVRRAVGGTVPVTSVPPSLMTKTPSWDPPEQGGTTVVSEDTGERDEFRVPGTTGPPTSSGVIVSTGSPCSRGGSKTHTPEGRLRGCRVECPSRPSSGPRGRRAVENDCKGGTSYSSRLLEPVLQVYCSEEVKCN